MNTTYFALAVPPFGAVLIGVVHADEFDAWKSGKARFVLHMPRRLALGQPAAQPGAVNAHCNVITIGPPFFGDTPQKTFYIENAMIEIIGEINNDVCSENNQLYQQYCSAYKEWEASRSGLHRPSMQDIANISNVTKFTKRS